MSIDARHPREIREAIRRGKYTGVTAGLAPGFVGLYQINVVVPGTRPSKVGLAATCPTGWPLALRTV